MSEKKKRGFLESMKPYIGEIIGLLILIPSAAPPFILWAKLNATSNCTECAAGWEAIKATFTYGPMIFVGFSVWLISLIVRLKKEME